jgi:hypothetical protein
VSDAIKKPPHYSRWKLQPAYFIMENNLPFDVGNVIKYVCRYDAKNGLEDLEKARGYLDMMIEKAKGNLNYVPGQEAPGQGSQVAGQPQEWTVHRDVADRLIAELRTRTLEAVGKRRDGLKAKRRKGPAPSLRTPQARAKART